MDSLWPALLLLALGLVLGAGGALLLGRRLLDPDRREPAPRPEPVLPPGVATVLSVLRSSALVLNEHDEVLKASTPAYALGLVRGNRLTVDRLARLARAVRRDGQIREAEMVLSKGRSSHPIDVTARVAPLTDRLLLVLVEDRSRERRVEAIRRDFVANVSHELKTPVGAINLLAEAVHEAADDAEAVQRFAGRMQTESHRLSQLVQQIIELSRLQADDPLEDPAPVKVDEIIDRAIDHSAIDAAAKQITVVHNGEPGLEILGNEEQVVVAVGNLVSNAVRYSPEHSTVVVGGRANDLMVDITVVDQGIGIPAREIDRIFERFYRVDPARHRSTGGTGLGLSIVKHVAAQHGGDVRVWSVEGQGSSFTLTLPRRTHSEQAPEAHSPDRQSTDPRTTDPQSTDPRTTDSQEARP